MKQTLHESPVPSIWRLRDVWLILPARTLALAGNALAFVTLMLAVHERVGEPWAVVALLACFAVPTILTMGLVGRLADRHDSRLLLIGGLSAQLAAVIALALTAERATTLSLTAELGIMLALVLIFELGQAVVAPVWSGLIPRVVGEERIGQAIAWQQGLGAVAGPLGGAAGGVLYQVAGRSAGFWVAAAATLALLGASGAVRTRRHPAAEGDDRTAESGDWASGVRIVAADRVVWPLFVALLVMVVLVEGVNAGEIFLAMDALGATPTQYGLGEVAAGVGGVAGAVLAGRLLSERSRVVGCLAGFGTACVAIALAGLAPSFWVYLGLVVLLAGAAGVGNATSGALVMTRTADADRGKVQAALAGLARTAGLFALALGGTTVTLLGPRPMFVVAGCAGVAAMGLASVRVTRPRALG